MASGLRGTIAEQQEPDFVGMIERHRESRSFWGKCTVILVVIGLLVAGYGLTAAVGWHSSAFWLGLFIAAMAVFPLSEALDRNDRASRLDGLRGTWRTMASQPDASPADMDRLAALIRKTHG